MQEPRGKAQVLELIRGERSGLHASFANLSDEQLSVPGAAGAWAVKDILAHVTWWEQRMVEKLHGRPTEHDQLGGEENDRLIDLFNERAYQEHRAQPPAAIIAAFRAAGEQVSAAIEDLDEDAVRAQWQFIAENTYLHYPEHAGQIRDWAKQYA